MAGRSANEYLRLLQSLLPRGWAWSRAFSSILSQFLLAIADELVVLEEEALSLLDERDTRYTFDLLEDHEYDLGLPDTCSDASALVTTRRREAQSKLVALGGQHEQYFIDVALYLGYPITISYFTPFWCGEGQSGDSCGDNWIMFYWQVNIAYTGDWIYFLSGDAQSGDSLIYIPISTSLFCALNRYKPAHTQIILNTIGPGFSRGFSTGFDSLPSYETSYLTGGFTHGFSSGFNVHFGGGFAKDGFSIGFDVPA